MKVIPLIFVIAMLFAGGIFTSCKKHLTEPPQDTTRKCDTCSDTTHHPCDTCNLNKDSLAHAFVWTEYINKIPGETNLTGVWVFAPNDIIIVANGLWHFDGTNFTLLAATDLTHHVLLNGGLSGCSIFALSQKDYWMVHVSEALHTTNGLDFDDFRFGPVNACWGTSSSDMFFVGNSGHIYHYDGASFTQMTSNTTKDLGSVWGTSNKDIWACGYNTSNGQTILTHYDGNSWQEDNLSVTKGINAVGGFNAVWAVDSAGHHFVATSGGILMHKLDGGMWQSDSGLIPNKENDGHYIGIAPRGGNTNDYFTIGPWGFIAHWNGKTWKQYTSLFDYGNPDYFSSAFSVNGNTACAVGEKSGQGWMAVGIRKQ